MGETNVLSVVLASGYHGPPQLTIQRAFTEWTLDPWALGIAVLVGGIEVSWDRRV
jgi:hypothetical protein